jgi:hypothetical protein
MLNDFVDVFDLLNRLCAYYYALIFSLESFERVGKEYNWDEKFKKLPDYLNITYSFKNLAYRIFQNYEPTENFVFDFKYTNIQLLPLQVKRIKFGSIGNIDVIGLGKVFEMLKDLVIHYIPNKDDKIDILIKQKEIEEKEQKILQMKISNLKNLGLSNDEILSIIGYESLHLNRIKVLVEQKKITNININQIANE